MISYDDGFENSAEIEVGGKNETGGAVNPSALDAHLNNNLKAPLLSKEEEIKYSRLAKNGDKSAFEILLKSNLRLVVTVARRYTGSGISLSDLISEGNIGLLSAIEKFDPEMGFRFSTYAVNWIKQSITRAIGNQSRTVRWPIYFHQAEYQYRREIERCKESKEPIPSDKEMAELLGISDLVLSDIKSVYKIEVSVDAPVGDSDSDNKMLDTLFEDGDNLDIDNYDIKEFKVYLKVLFSRLLSERDEKVLILRFGIGCDPMTLSEVGEIIGVTRERVRQIEAASLKKLKSHLIADGYLQTN